MDSATARHTHTHKCRAGVASQCDGACRPSTALRIPSERSESWFDPLRSLTTILSKAEGRVEGSRDCATLGQCSPPGRRTAASALRASTGGCTWRGAPAARHPSN